ncbi:MAG: response regulator, partial [Litorilinea sp.]
MVETVTRAADRPWHILLVEDDPDDAELIQLALGNAGFLAKFTRVETGAQMHATLEEAHIDAILSDYAIPGFGGREALEIMQGCGLDIPFIIVSGEIGESTAVALMKAGVHDYISKQNLTRLAPAIERELRDCAIRHARRQTEQALHESQQRHATLIQSIHGIVWEAPKLPGVYTFVSPQAQHLLGYPPQRWLEEADFWHNNIHGEDHTRVVEEYQNAIARGRPFQLEYRRTTAQGGMLWLRDVVSLAETNADQTILRGVTFDVTERRAAEDERERLLQI